MTPSESRLAAALADRYRIERELGAGEPPGDHDALVSGVERPPARAAALRVVDQWAAGNRFPMVVVARFYPLLGEPEKALALLERAVEQRAPFTTYIGRWTELHRLANEPRYRAVLRRIGLPQPVAGGTGR